jgi:hypothetical protein
MARINPCLVTLASSSVVFSQPSDIRNDVGCLRRLAVVLFVIGHAGIGCVIGIIITIPMVRKYFVLNIQKHG